jgi:hypothetical protein
MCNRLIAVMLGILRMDIDTCIEEYLNIAPQIFPVEGKITGSLAGRLLTVARGKQRFDPDPFEAAIKGLVKTHLGARATRGEDTLFRFEDSRNNQLPQCKA